MFSSNIKYLASVCRNPLRTGSRVSGDLCRGGVEGSEIFYCSYLFLL